MEKERKQTPLDAEIMQVREAAKNALRYTDMMNIYGCGIVKARNIIRDIRRTCGGGRLGAGMVLPSEYKYWREHPKTNYVKYL